MNYLGDYYLAKAVEQLKRGRDGERRAKVLYLRFWGNQTLECIAQQLNVSGARVRQIEAKALGVIKSKLRKSDISDFLAATI
jgi:DNA-directed RNA polymerase sigma subunit (sigma70/sigma32)